MLSERTSEIWSAPGSLALFICESFAVFEPWREVRW